LLEKSLSLCNLLFSSKKILLDEKKGAVNCACKPLGRGTPTLGGGERLREKNNNWLTIQLGNFKKNG
jgi:hypothetical protein